MCTRKAQIVAFYIGSQIMETGQLSQRRNVVTQSSVIHHKRNIIPKLKVCDFYFFHICLHKLHLSFSPFPYTLMNFCNLL